MVDASNVLWCRPGVRPSSPYTILLRIRPEEAKALFIRKLHEQHGHVVLAAAALGIHPKRAYQLVYVFGLRGKPREIRQALKSRFRLPAA